MLEEPSGLALSLIMLGSKNVQVIKEIVNYAQETQHENILHRLLEFY